MSNQLVTRFAAFNLSDQEVLQGSIYTTLQLQVLQNHLSTAAEEKLSLEFTPNDPLTYAQQEAYLRAKMEMLQYLIDSSQASQETLSQTHQSGE